MADRRKQQGTFVGGPNSKKARHDADFGSSPGSFEEELALFETIESETDRSQRSLSQDSQESVSSAKVSEIVVSNRNRWSRAEPPLLVPSKDKLVFQQIEIDNYVGKELLSLLWQPS